MVSTNTSVVKVTLQCYYICQSYVTLDSCIVCDLNQSV